MKSALKQSALKAEYLEIINALHLSNFNKRKASELLGIDRKTLYNKLAEFQEQGMTLQVSSVISID